MERAVRGLNRLGLRVFAGPHQAGVLSFLPPDGDCEKAAGSFAARGLPCGLGYTVHRRPMRAPERWRLGRSEPALARMHRRSKPGAFYKGQLPFGAGTKDRRGHGVDCLKF